MTQHDKKSKSVLLMSCYSGYTDIYCELWIIWYVSHDQKYNLKLLEAYHSLALLPTQNHCQLRLGNIVNIVIYAEYSKCGVYNLTDYIGHVSKMLFPYFLLMQRS